MPFRRLLVAFIAASVATACRADEPVPPPAETPAEIVVSGRTSTLKNVVVRKVGLTIPLTYSGDKVKNTPGYTWYVSRHYALKTDLSDEQARHYLTLLELAFPHYVELFGRELPDLDRKRMAVVYAKSKESLAEALKSDGISWNFNGGGITYEGYNAGYQYPSGSLQYHLRYILLHECAHLYQICLTGTISNVPNWYVEGVADTLANHVWEEAARRLTVNVVDKATVNNYWDEGLRRMRSRPFTVGGANPRGPKGKAVGGRDVGFLLVTFFSTDLERWMKFRLWRDELLRLDLRGTYHERSFRLLGDLFGGWPKLDADFKNWVRQRRASFHYVEWGWEQDGETLMSYGFPNTGSHSQTDLLHPPGETPTDDSLVMDFPRRAGDPPPLVARVGRGTETPTVGCVLGFQKNPTAGQAGLGFGVIDRKCLRVMIDAKEGLIIDGSDLGAGKQATALPVPVRQATAAGGYQLGLSVRIGETSVDALVRAGKSGKLASFKASLPINPEQRERLLDKPMAVLSKGGLHFITPYIDVPAPPPPDLKSPAPPNRWRLAFERELFAVYRSAWRLGDRAPKSLLALRDELLAAATESPESRQEALADFNSALPQVLKDVRTCGAAAALANDVSSQLKSLR
jgi:hypothetical protein